MKNRSKNKKKNAYSGIPYLEPEFTHEAQFDFHGLGSLTPYDIEKYLTDFIEECFAAGKDRVLVITGKGSIVRPRVKNLLGQNPRIDRFQYAGYFNGQDGAFEVWLKNE